ncbi:hypothetical protein B566_EDAN002211 [Ephemera danica]|nr:hypothetical protein B566_EDAN002211 [Ephemera danica]
MQQSTQNISRMREKSATKLIRQDAIAHDDVEDGCSEHHTKTKEKKNIQSEKQAAYHKTIQKAIANTVINSSQEQEIGCQTSRLEHSPIPCSPRKQLQDAFTTSPRDVLGALALSDSENDIGSVKSKARCYVCNTRLRDIVRWRCLDCKPQLELCDSCYIKRRHDSTHTFCLVEKNNRSRTLTAPRLSLGGTAPATDCLASLVLSDSSSSEEVDDDDVFRLHDGVECSWCHAHVKGIRWNCADCHEYDLCNDCYTAARHAPDHTFYRIDWPGAIRVEVAPRRKSKGHDQS